MDFTFDLNKFLRDEITLVDSTLQPCRQNGVDRHNFRQLQTMLYEVVDKMGAASAQAQNLHGPITTGKKLEFAGHRLYIMKDEESNRGHGSTVGILKVGQKKLFVYDNGKAQHELEPLCVLDFYVHESRQRMGCGKKLFDYMLQSERIPVRHLAIDRPSAKFLSFLNRHYGLDVVIPQVNNFVIFEGFFNNRSDLKNNRRAQADVQGRPFSGPNRLRQGSPYNSNVSQAYRQSPLLEQRVKNNDYNWVVPGISSKSQSRMGAGQMMYSRHGIQSMSNLRGYTPSPSFHKESPAITTGPNYQQTQYDPASNDPQRPGHSLPPPHPNQRVQRSNQRSQRIETQEEYQKLSNSRVTSPAPVIDPRYPQEVLLQSIVNQRTDGRPPSGKYSKMNDPSEKKDRPPANSQNMLNMHQSYQGRNGHLSLPPVGSTSIPGTGPTPSVPAYTTPIVSPYPNQQSNNTSWTVSGVLRNQRVTAPDRYYSYSNRLW
ncbi:unnamed protein product [Lymnaea stagnalis]|uniref:Alpha-tubulin N-acetyltransferase n=1 Tax=Lymnaea stagnalis TaxID=6523 RepID=A0AAV2HRM3_LYMST